jgi:hypothetical protein
MKITMKEIGGSRIIYISFPNAYPKTALAIYTGPSSVNSTTLFPLEGRGVHSGIGILKLNLFCLAVHP